MKTFLEIGSCDFDTLSYLSHYGWRGIILEPIPTYFNNLKFEENIHYINAAIYPTDGVTTMTCAEDDVVDRDHDFAGMSSVYNNTNPLLTKKVEVKTICFETLFKVTNITEIDYLKIDTEGYDGEVLQMFPWDICKPKYIKFESVHLHSQGPSPIFLEDTLKLVRSHGYHIEMGATDTYAIKL
tara:strand:- start:1713 stop:2261 length:549 start_codon:yes stop_codon:yes gene_type:complete